MTPPRGLHHLALRVADLERSAQFYNEVIGLPRHSSHHAENGVLRAIWLELGGGAILMLERALRGTGEASGSGHVLALAIEDLSAWEARLAAAGVAIVDRTGYTLFVADPDGHRVGLSVYRVPPATAG